MEDNTGGIVRWDDKLLLQRLCEAFKRAKDEGNKEVSLLDFHGHFSGIEFEAMKEVLQNQCVVGNLIEMNDKVMKLTDHGVNECKSKHPRIYGD